MTAPGNEKEGRAGYNWLLWVGLVPFLYVLSIGPVALIASTGPARRVSAVRGFYQPVIWLHDHTPLKRPLEIYIELWGVK